MDVMFSRDEESLVPLLCVKLPQTKIRSLTVGTQLPNRLITVVVFSQRLWLFFFLFFQKIVYLVLLSERVSLWLATVTVSAGTADHWKNKDEATPVV